MRTAGRARGQALVLVSLLMVVLTGLAALAIDVGEALIYKERSEVALEAAALAAATQLPDPTAALAAARESFQANGFEPESLLVITPWDGDNMKVRLEHNAVRPTILGRAIGKDLIAFSTSVLAQRMPPGIFDYALFSSSTFDDLRVAGSELTVIGSVHGNEDLRFNGATINVSGRLDASGRLVNNGSVINAGLIELGAPVIRMPTYGVSNLRAMCATRYDGSQHWSGVTLNVSGGIFVDGDLKLSGVKISGQGLIAATGDIEVTGTSFTYAGESDAVCLYSMSDITIEGTDMTAQGIFYAPNGRVNVGGSNVRVEGAIAGYTINFHGADPEIIHDSAANEVLPGIHARLIR